MGNVLSFGFAAVKARLFKTRTPLNVMWRITNKCDSRCTYCNIWKKESHDLPTAKILSMIDEMDSCGTKRIGFVGGEALLRQDFDRILDRVKMYDIYVTLVSKKNKGYASARNTGIDNSNGDLIFFTDADCIADKNWVMAGVKFMRENPAFIAASNRGSNQPSLNTGARLKAKGARQTNISHLMP